MLEHHIGCLYLLFASQNDTSVTNTILTKYDPYYIILKNYGGKWMTWGFLAQVT